MDDQCVVSEKIHTRPMEGHCKFLGGGEVLKAKFSGISWGEGGAKQKKLPWGKYGYFLKLHNKPINSEIATCCLFIFSFNSHQICLSWVAVRHTAVETLSPVVSMAQLILFWNMCLIHLHQKRAFWTVVKRSIKILYRLVFFYTQLYYFWSYLISF